MQNSDIGIIIPAYKAAATIGRAIDCLLPSVPASNIIVVIDGPDLELEQAARNAASGASSKIQIVVMPGRCGASACRNAGLALAPSEYVMFMDADDYLEGDMLASALQAARSANADIVFGRYALEMPDGSRTYVNTDQIYQPATCETVMKMWLTKCFTPPCAVVWRTQFVRDIGGWDEALTKNQDGDIVLRALAGNPQLALSAEGCSVYSQGDNPTRISLQQNIGTFESQMSVLEKVRNNHEALPFDVSSELATSYYTLARLAFSYGIVDIGHRAEKRARALGLTGQLGSTGHRMLAAVFGLSGKQQLVRRARHYMGKSL